jgi:hypothetical protein
MTTKGIIQKIKKDWQQMQKLERKKNELI